MIPLGLHLRTPICGHTLHFTEERKREIVSAWMLQADSHLSPVPFSLCAFMEQLPQQQCMSRLWPMWGQEEISGVL